MKQIKLVLADSHILFRKTLQNYLETQPNIEIIMQCSDANDLVKRLQYVSIDVLLIDTSLPNAAECDLFRLVQQQYPDIKVLCLSANKDLNLVCDLLDQGIFGYISKLDEPQVLLDALRCISSNNIYRNALYTEALYWNQNKVKDTRKDTPALNDREKQILQFLWEEKSNKEIAEQIFLSIRSIEKIRQDMKQKLGLKSTVGLIKYGLYKKIIGVRAAVLLIMVTMFS